MGDKCFLVFVAICLTLITRIGPLCLFDGRVGLRCKGVGINDSSYGVGCRFAVWQFVLLAQRIISTDNKKKQKRNLPTAFDK